MPGEAVPIATGVWRIPTLGRSAINSFAFEDDDGSVTLVDAGLRGATGGLVRALASIGKEPRDVRRILLTHAHFDHTGGAARLRAKTGARVHVHESDVDFVRLGRRPPVSAGRPLARVLAHATMAPPRCPVDVTFAEGDVIPVAGGIRVLHTPGHTPGHASFLHQRSGVLVTGDALFNFFDRIAYSFALFCSDFRMSEETADRLAEVEYEVAAFTHGPPIFDNARETVRAFLERRLRRDR